MGDIVKVIRYAHIECISIHFKDGNSILYCEDEFEKISHSILQDVKFLFAVVTQIGKRNPLIYRCPQELFDLLCN